MINKKQLLDQIDNLFKTAQISNDVHGFLLTTPVYGDYNSYSAYVNQNKNNEMYQHVKNNKPRLIVKNMNDVYNKYFENDRFTLKSFS